MDGWDATVMVSALATIVMDYPLKPQGIQREGIRGLTMEDAARRERRSVLLSVSWF